MKLFKKDLMQGLKVVVLAFILSVGVSYVFADWTPPRSTPPTCSTSGASPDPACFPPIHVGAATQEKAGGIIAGALRSKLLAIFDAQVQIKGGSPGDKKILASDGTGLASWKFPSELDIVNSDDPETICRTLGGTWTSGSCSFPGGGNNNNAETICTTLGGVWNDTTSRCAFNGGTGGPGGGGGGSVTNIIGGTTNTINVTNPQGPTVTIDADMSKICQSLGGTWNGTACTGIGGNVSVTEFGPYSRLNKTSIGVHTYCAISRISTSLENHGARVWKEGSEWFVASISSGGEMPGYSDSSLQRFNVTCFDGVVSGNSVTKIIAGTGISVSPSNGTGAVTVSATGGSSTGGGGSWLSSAINLPAVGDFQTITVPFSPVYVVVHSNNSNLDHSDYHNLSGSSTIVVPGVDKEWTWRPRDSEGPRSVRLRASWISGNQVTITWYSQSGMHSSSDVKLYVTAH